MNNRRKRSRREILRMLLGRTIFDAVIRIILLIAGIALIGYYLTLNEGSFGSGFGGGE